MDRDKKSAAAAVYVAFFSDVFFQVWIVYGKGSLYEQDYGDGSQLRESGTRNTLSRPHTASIFAVPPASINLVSSIYEPADPKANEKSRRQKKENKKTKKWQMKKKVGRRKTLTSSTRLNPRDGIFTPSRDF